MLKKIKEVTQDVGESFYAMMNGRVAVDPDTGAYLVRSHGFTKSGDTKYVLIIPKEKPANLFGEVKWDERGRKRLRAWSDEEAIELANKKLAEARNQADRQKTS